MEHLSTVLESAQQPDQEFNNYLPNVTTGELLTPEPSWRPIHYPQYYSPQYQPMNPQPLPQIHSCYEADGTVFADNYYERNSGPDGMYENLFGDGQQSCRNMSEYDPSLQMNQFCPPQNAFSLEQQFEQGRHQQFGETPYVNESEFPQQQRFFQGGVYENMKKETFSGWSNLETDNKASMEAKQFLEWSNLDLCENYEAGLAFAGNYERSSGLDGMYENVFGDGQQSCKNMSEYDPNFQMSQCCPPQNAFSLEQQFEQGKHQVEKETSSGWSNLETDNQTPMGAKRCENYETGFAFAGNYERSSGLDGMYENLFGDGQQSCRNMGEYDSNLQMNHRYCQPQNAFPLEQQFEQGRHQQFGKTSDVNEGEFPQQQGFQTLSYSNDRLFQGGVYENMEKETFSGLFNLDLCKTDKQTPMMETNPFECDQCKKIFSSSSSLRRHKANKRNHIRECNLCTETFSTQSKLNFHKHEVHGEEKPSQCIGCGKTFILKKKMDVHKQRHSAQRPFQCYLCAETFFYWCTLKKHEWTHIAGKRFRCDKCKKTFVYLSSLKNHTILCAEKLFQCNQCKKTYTSRHVLNLHKRTVHNKKRPFECDVCGRTTTQRAVMEAHKRMHSEQKPFKCDECKETFSHWCDLKEHEKTHAGDRLFQCDVCEETFTEEHRLEDHRRTHTGGNLFRCDICEKTFSRIQYLEYHRWAHSGKKPFKCNKCTETFFDSSSLKKHERIHVGERPFQYDENDHLVSHTGTEIEERSRPREKSEEKFSSLDKLKLRAYRHPRIAKLS